MAVVTGCLSECKISVRCSYRIPGHDKSDSRIHVFLNNGYKLCVTKFSTTRVQRKMHTNLYILRRFGIHPRSHKEFPLPVLLVLKCLGNYKETIFFSSILHQFCHKKCLYFTIRVLLFYKSWNVHIT
jgi:hypothetical protein